MNPHLKLALSSLSLLLASIAHADSPTMQFACDTPAAHYSSWSQTISARGVEVEGKLKFNELRKDKKWSPGANVYLSGGADGKTSYGLRIFGLAKQPDSLFAEVLKGGERAPVGPLGGMMPNNQEPIAFKLKLDAKGTFTLNVAGDESSVQAGAFKLSEFTLSCSTVDVEFSDVRITLID